MRGKAGRRRGTGTGSAPIGTAMNKTRVRVVQARPDISTELEGCLRRLGCEVPGRADTGESAIRVAKTTRPDVVLLDIGLDGVVEGSDAGQANVQQQDRKSTRPNARH